MDVSIKLNTEALPANTVVDILKAKGEADLALKRADHEFNLALFGQVSQVALPMAEGFKAAQEARLAYAKGSNLEREIRLVEAKTRLAEVEARSEELRAETAKAEASAELTAVRAAAAQAIREAEDRADRAVRATEAELEAAVRRHLDNGDYRTVTGVFVRE